MSRRSEITTTAALVVAVILSACSAYTVWEGYPTGWFYAFITAAFIALFLSIVSAGQAVRSREIEENVRVPLLWVTRDEFRKEPPIGKRPH